MSNKKQAVLSLSGGMDSSTLLLHLLANDYEVTALSFDYGQKHRVELERATALASYLRNKKLPVTHQIIKLDGLTSLLNSALVEGGQEVPEGYYAEDNQKETVVPNRNKIFSSLIQAVALSIANRTNSEVLISLGLHSGDHAVYPDCRQEFRDIDHQAFLVGNWDAERVNVYTPYLEGNKLTILQDGEKCCEKLGLEFEQVYKMTNTSYKPLPSGNSDYRSASSVERILAFSALGRPDPIQYEDETGLVSWEVAEKHALEVERIYLLKLQGV